MLTNVLARVPSAKGAPRRALAMLAGLVFAAVSLAPTFARAEGNVTAVHTGEVFGETADQRPASIDRDPGTARAEFWGELPDAAEPSSDARPVLPGSGVNLLIAANKSGARRYGDTYTSSGKKRRRSLASLIRSRRADDANFRNRTRFLARRMEESRRANPPELAFVQTGEEFLNALVAASRRGPIANLVIYGHAASTALFMREDRGFYASVMEVAKSSHVVSGEDVDKDEQLRLVGSRDLADFERLLGRGDIKFARNAVIVFAGCGVAGRRDIEPNGIAARMAELVEAKVIASIDVTDQSMARGRDFRNHEYSRRSWVRFIGGRPPERLNTRVIDALKQLNLDGEAVAAGPAQETPGPRASN